ncbi:WW domain-binding protein 2-like [Diadema antillarum]|uniref:WW domain-binding protein 2-like n=1 Tax=Diadema antillarum TaxID=105358 RepID=UPI003A8697D4
MALNQANTKDGSLVLQGDRVILMQDGVEATFEMTPMVDHFKGTKKGTVYLTSLVMAFVPKSGLMKSLTVPFANLKNLEVKQPMFGANYLTGNILAQPNGGFEGKVKFKMVFNNGGAIDMAQGLMKAVKRAHHAPQPAPAVNPMPGAYPAPYPGAYPGAYPAAYPAAAPPQPGYQNGACYPPQPGLYQPPTAYPPAQPMQPPPPYVGAAPPTAPPQTAYWDPSNQNVYIPEQSQPTAPPPPYTEKPKTE